MSQLDYLNMFVDVMRQGLHTLYYKELTELLH